MPRDIASLKKVKNEMRTHWKGPEDFVDVFLAALISKASILFLSAHGKGKSFLAEVASKVMNATMSRIQGSVGLTQSKFIGRYNVAKLIKGEEEIIWNEFVDAEIKFFDEINRVPAPILSDLFAIMAEKKAYLGSECKPLGEFAFIATMNPGDDGTFQLPPPLIDRFDVCLVVPAATTMDKIDIIMKQNAEVSPVLPAGGLKGIWAEVEEVQVSKEVMIYASAYVRAFQMCEKGEKETLLNFPACCEECDYKNGSMPCSKINGHVSDRALLSLVRLAKGMAYLAGRKEVIFSDMTKVMLHVVYHRVEFLPAHMNGFKTKRELIEKVVIDDTLTCVHDLITFNTLATAVLEGKRPPHEIDRFKNSQNLLIKEVYNGITEEIKKIATLEKGRIMEEMSSMGANDLINLISTASDPDIAAAAKVYLKAKSSVTFTMGENSSDEIVERHLLLAGVRQHLIDSLMTDAKGEYKVKGEYIIAWKGQADAKKVTIVFDDPVKAENFSLALQGKEELPF